MRSAATVLVVEDNPLTRKMLRLTLESEGYAVVEAADGRAAMASARRRLPDLVLQDLILPDMNGFELVKQLRALFGSTPVPIVALSGFLGRLEAAETEQAGFTAMLMKPVEPTRLLEFVRAYCAPDVPAPPTTRRRRVLVVDDDSVQLKLTRISFEHAGYDVTTASSVADALPTAHASTPDVILSDVLMPDVDGFQLCLEVRRDPVLARTPVVLLSAWYETVADRDLARQVGASALVRRTPDLDVAMKAVAAAVEPGVPPPSDTPSDHVKLEHARAVIDQLKRQVETSASLARRCTLQAAQISLLSGVADALTRKTSLDTALRDVLAATLDAAGISKGALYMTGPNGALALKHGIGFSETQLERLPGFFGQRAFLEETIAHRSIIAVPSAGVPAEAASAVLEGAGVVSVQIVPLISKDRVAGAMVLAAHESEAGADESVAFARAMGNQLVHFLELGLSFAELTASEQRYRTLMSSANDGISLLGLDGVIREVNPRMAEMLGLPIDQVVGRHVRDFAVPGREQTVEATFDASSAPGPGRTPTVELRRSDGSTILVEFSTTLLDLVGERVAFTVGRDVTEQVKAQTQLMISDRMASLGSMAAGVAHEINNPLAAVLANIEFVFKGIERLAQTVQDPELPELLEAQRDARDAASRVHQIVRDLRIFSRVESDRREAVDVRRVLDTTVRMAWNEIRHRARMVKDYGEVPLVDASEARLAQIFLNLIVNAAQAIPEGHADENEIRVRTRKDAAGGVIVEIGDTGPGIPPEIMARLFTPFFTTKPEGIGTGLGLSICQRIVAALGGRIEVESTVGVGTVFRVLLPPGKTAQLTTLAEVSIPAAVRRGRILIVDDEAAVGVAIRRMLGSDHDVVVVTKAAAAADLVRAGERFDVILSDLMMPVMGGMELHADLKKSAPDQADRIIFMTGGAFTPRAHAFLEAIPNRRLEKPFNLALLMNLINERLR